MFDTEAKVWVTEEGIEAKTLAELQLKLPGWTIKDYYPNGYVAIREGFLRESLTVFGTARSAMRTNHNGRSRAVSRRITAQEAQRKLEAVIEADATPLKDIKPARSRMDWKDAALRAKLAELVEEGLFAREIAAQIGANSRHSVISACHRYGLKLKTPQGFTQKAFTQKPVEPREGAASG